MKFTWGENSLDVRKNFTNQNNMYLEHVAKIKNDFKNGNVIEIGPGNGKFACLLSKKYSIKKYTLLDLERVVHHSETRMRKYNPEVLIEVNFAEEFEKCFFKKYDLLVSNVCIPETPKEYRRTLLNNLIPNCKSSIIIGQLDETGEGYKKWIINLFEENYDNVLCDLTDYKNCYALIGY